MTFQAPPLASVALILLRAAFEKRSLILVLSFALSWTVDRLASSAWERALAPPEEPAPAAFSFAASLTEPALSRTSVTAAVASRCCFFALSFWIGLGCWTRKAPRMNG